MKLFRSFPLTVNLIFAMLVCLIFVALWYFANAEDFRLSALSNYLATAAGVAIGIPTALALSAIQEKAADEKSQEKLTALKREQQMRILRLVQKEMLYNLQILENRRDIQTRVNPYLNYPGVKAELWNSLSSSGDLKWIDDLELLDVISSAYYQIRCILPLEIVYLEPSFAAMARQLKGSGFPVTSLDVNAIDRMIYSVDEAIPAITNALARLGQQIQALEQ